MFLRMMIGMLALALALCVHVTPAAAAMPASLVDRGERATALVDVNSTEGRAFGSAFCIDSKGIFVTDGHVVVGSTGAIKIVLRPGEKDQRVLTAQVLGIDYGADLALLQTEKSEQIQSLVLGNSDAIVPTQDVTAFGYPFGNMLSLDKNTYPNVSVNSGKVTALRKQNGDLGLIQIDALVNPGNSGGPVLDADGKVIGIVESGVSGAGLNFATPVARLKKMMQGPLVVIDPLSVDYAQRTKPQKFSVRVSSLTPGVRPYDVTLQITDPKGAKQLVSGKTTAGKCELLLAATTDATEIKWEPFSGPPPVYKFSLTLKDAQKVVCTQEGAIDLMNIPLAVEVTGGGAGGGAVRNNSMDPLPADAAETQIVGAAKMEPMREVNPKEQLAKGIHYTLGDNKGRQVIGNVQLVYGKGPGGKGVNVFAKEGYVVGGFNVNAAQYIYGLQVIFISDKKGKLDSADTYTSDWIGTAPSDKGKQLCGNGEHVIGICGRKGIYMRAIGLVFQKPAADGAAQPATH